VRFSDNQKKLRRKQCPTKEPPNYFFSFPWPSECFLPHLGACLFTCCAVGRVSLEGITKEITPFIVALIIAVLFVTYIPAISLTIPRLLGLI